MGNFIRKIIKEELLVESSSTDETLDFETIYNRYWDEMLRNVCMRYTKDENKAKDYCQNGFMKVNRKLPSYKDTGSLGGWIARVIKNNIIDEMRKKKLNYSDDPDWGRIRVDNDQPYEEKYNVDMIEKVLPELTPAYKKVFELYYFENLTHKEIANHLGVSEGTSKSNLAKAKIKVRKLIRDRFKV